MSDKESNIKDTAAKKGVFTVSVKSSFFWVELVRKIIQFLSFVLFNGAILGLSIVPLVLPVLWTSGSPHGTVGEAFGVLQGLIYNIIFPWLPLASIFLFAVFTGRFLCGWVCPFGFIQDLLNYIKKRKRDISVPTHKNLIYVKYFILTLTFIISIALAAESVSPTGPIFGKILGVFAQAPFTALSPSDTVFAVVPKMFSFFYQNGYQNFWVSLSSPLLWTRLVTMGAVCVLAVYIPRSWCRYLCPQGAFLALISRFSFLGLRRDFLKCTKAACKTCVEVCPTRVPILNLPWEKFNDSECIYCLRCVSACSTKAIRLKFP